MFTMDEVLSKRNQRAAFEYLEHNKGRGYDGMSAETFKEYWDMNREQIEDELHKGNYIPGVVKNYDIINGAGKKRTISNLTMLDKFITRLLAQKLKRYLEPTFLENSYAYQDNKGILQAVLKAREYANAGNSCVVEIDLKNYFDTIPLDRVIRQMEERISDIGVITLMRRYLYCKVDDDERIIEKNIGLIQGNSISPILSNLYLHSLDEYMEEEELCWIRFADNIYIFVKDENVGIEIYNSLCSRIKQDYILEINEKKSGVHDIYDRHMLGYMFYKTKGKLEIRKYQYKKSATYSNWHQCVVQKINREYHIVKDGILNKRDYALLFENEEQRHHIPVEIVDNINIYNEVAVSSGVLRTLGNSRIALSVFDKYGNILGRYMPEELGNYSAYLLKQCELYINTDRRLKFAKSMEIAGIHNMRANLRYYNKKIGGLQEHITAMGEMIAQINEAKSVESLLLIEARARQKYYMSFNQILRNTGFEFTTRTKRPPKDELNALISFGNTLLYNLFLQIIWKTALDPRIGVVHATNRRSHSLNLDFADIFKPIITDRVIFTLLNCRQIRKEDHFEGNAEDGVYMNNEGKKIFLEEFNEKLDSKIVVNNKSISYRQLMIDEVHHFQKAITDEEKYKPYKYY